MGSSRYKFQPNPGEDLPAWEIATQEEVNIRPTFPKDEVEEIKKYINPKKAPCFDRITG